MNFKSWCQSKWYDHIDELFTYTGKPPAYEYKDYLLKYKWWLKREYRFQKSRQQS